MIDYIHYPVGEIKGKNFEDMCFYEMSRTYKNKILTFSQMTKIEKRCDKVGSDKEDNDILSPLKTKFSGKKYPFKNSHPGFHFFHI